MSLSSLDRTFTADRPLAPANENAISNPQATDYGYEFWGKAENLARITAWPLAVVLVFHRVLFTALNGTLTDDFSTVFDAIRRFLNGHAVYEQAYQNVDPLYLYNPGATLLLSPLGFISDFETARTGFIALNALAIILALGFLTKLVGQSLAGWVWPASIAAAFMTEAVINTLAFSNINGVLLLALSFFLWAFCRGHQPRDGAVSGAETSDSTDADGEVGIQAARGWLWLAGLVLGLAIVIKPQFAPLLFLAVAKLDWRTFLSGVSVPIALNVAAWPLLADSGDYLNKLVPYLSTTRDYANSSWAGLQAYFGIPASIYYAVWVLFAFITAAGILVLLRWRHTDPILWSVTTSGLIMVGIFFLSSLGQQYYSMWLFPVMFTAALARSVFHSWTAWLAAVLFLIPNSWESWRWPDIGRWMDTYLGTLGWALLIIATTATAWGWLASQRKGVESQA